MKLPSNKEIAECIDRPVSTMASMSKTYKKQYEKIKVGVFCELNGISELDLKRLALDKQMEREKATK